MPTLEEVVTTFVFAVVFITFLIAFCAVRRNIVIIRAQREAYAQSNFCELTCDIHSNIYILGTNHLSVFDRRNRTLITDSTEPTQTNSRHAQNWNRRETPTTLLELQILSQNIADTSLRFEVDTEPPSYEANMLRTAQEPPPTYHEVVLCPREQQSDPPAYSEHGQDSRVQGPTPIYTITL